MRFGTGFQDIFDAIAVAASEPDPDARLAAYQQVNPLLAEHIPMVPIAYGGSAMAYQAGVQNAHTSPLTKENPLGDVAGGAGPVGARPER